MNSECRYCGDENVVVLIRAEVAYRDRIPMCASCALDHVDPNHIADIVRETERLAYITTGAVA